MRQALPSRACARWDRKDSLSVACNGPVRMRSVDRQFLPLNHVVADVYAVLSLALSLWASAWLVRQFWDLSAQSADAFLSGLTTRFLPGAIVYTSFWLWMLRDWGRAKMENSSARNWTLWFVILMVVPCGPWLYYMVVRRPLAGPQRRGNSGIRGRAT